MPYKKSIWAGLGNTALDAVVDHPVITILTILAVIVAICAVLIHAQNLEVMECSKMSCPKDMEPRMIRYSGCLCVTPAK
jgi:hypothetical protein